MNMNAMREGVEKLYPYDKWRQKVKKMSDMQVLAIYQKYQDKIQKIYKEGTYGQKSYNTNN